MLLPKMKSKSIVMIVCISAICCGLAGCRTREIVPVMPVGAGLSAAEDVFYALETRSFPFRTLSARMQVELAADTKKSLRSRANLKIVHDRELQLSIQPIAGIELIRIALSTDSIHILDRMNKRYLSESLVQTGDHLNVALNFHNVQALFVNRIFQVGETALEENAFRRFRSEQTAQGYIFYTQNRNGLNYRFTTEGPLLSTAEITNKDQTIRLDYSSFASVNSQPFPMDIRAEWRTDDALQGALSVHYLNVDMDKPVDMQFTIPKDYERIGLSQILKLITQL